MASDETEHGEIRSAVREICARFGDAYWRDQDRLRRYPGEFVFAAEYDVERKLRETRLYKVAPINNDLVLAYVAQHVLGLPKSYRSLGVVRAAGRFASRGRIFPGRTRSA